MKTIELEQLPAETRQLVEEWTADAETVMISRGGQPYAEIALFDAHYQHPITPEEEEEMAEIVRQGDEDFAAGRYITLDEFKRKYADRLKEIGR